MKPLAIPALALLMVQTSAPATPGVAQEASSIAWSPQNTLHVSSNLVLIDVIALKNGLPDKTLGRDDFQVFDDGHPVSIQTFDTGASARPLALWFVVLCNMQGYETYASGLFAKHIDLFKPALKDLPKQDSVGVAHWCDDGVSKLDLRPTSNIDAAVGVLEQVLAPVPDTKDHDRTGELALQRTLQLIVDATRSTQPQPLPVVIFLYGDHSGMPKSEANHFINELLETSAIVFGLKDRRSPQLGRFESLMWGEQAAIANYIAMQTGGQYLRETPETYGAGLAEILQELHFRYELGFQPEALDGKRHELRVRLADSAKKQHTGLRLRYRAAYVPARSS